MAGHSPQNIYLNQGPVCGLMNAREKLIAAMAADLLAHKAIASRGDAIMTLRHCGYADLDVFLLVDEAIFSAKQQIIAEVMVR